MKLMVKRVLERTGAEVLSCLSASSVTLRAPFSITITSITGSTVLLLLREVFLLLARCRSGLAWRELVIRMSLCVVVTFGLRQLVVELSNALRLQRPALTRDGRDDLMIVLDTPGLGPFSVRGTVQHEGVHGAGDVSVPLLHLFVAVHDWPVDPCLHVSDRDLHVFRELTERLVDLGGFGVGRL